jgi:hypothetical protein
MKHLLMDPAFPDLIAEWAGNDSRNAAHDCANDNCQDIAGDLADPLLITLGRLEVAATRLW